MVDTHLCICILGAPDRKNRWKLEDAMTAITPSKTEYVSSCAKPHLTGGDDQHNNKPATHRYD